MGVDIPPDVAEAADKHGLIPAVNQWGYRQRDGYVPSLAERVLLLAVTL